MIAIKTATECHDKTFRYGRIVHSVCSQTQDARSISGQVGVTFLIYYNNSCYKYKGIKLKFHQRHQHIKD